MAKALEYVESLRIKPLILEAFGGPKDEVLLESLRNDALFWKASGMMLYFGKPQELNILKIPYNIPEMRGMGFVALIFLAGAGSLAQEERSHPPDKISGQNLQKARKALTRIFKSYQLKSLWIEVEQEIFLPSIKTTMKSKGDLYIKGRKFQLKLNGSPSSLLLFDGEFLWYQADTNEALVVQLKNPPHTYILTHFFSQKSFFENFQIQQFQKSRQNYIFEIQPKIEMEKLDKIFMKTGAYISELRLIWKDMDSWQKYKFSKPRSIKSPARRFRFFSEGFQVIEKESL